MESQADQLNHAEAEKFWDKFKKTCYKQGDNTIGTIINNNQVLVNDEQKAQHLYAEIFMGKHLEGSDFDDQWKTRVKKIVSNQLANQMSAKNFNTGPINGNITTEELSNAIHQLETAIKCLDGWMLMEYTH